MGEFSLMSGKITYRDGREEWVHRITNQRVTGAGTVLMLTVEGGPPREIPMSEVASYVDGFHDVEEEEIEWGDE